MTGQYVCSWLHDYKWELLSRPALYRIDECIDKFRLLQENFSVNVFCLLGKFLVETEKRTCQEKLTDYLVGNCS